jgi:hypothetical protein
MPDLAAYRDYLLQARELSPSSVAAYLSTVRGRYQALLSDNALREWLYASEVSVELLRSRPKELERARAVLPGCSTHQQYGG